MNSVSKQLDREDELGLRLLEAQDKFDYFLLGAMFGAVAYLAQTNPYAPVGLNRQTFFLASLLFLGAGIFFGLKRLQVTIAVLSANVHALKHHGEGNAAKASSWTSKAGLEAGKAKGWVKWRNGCLMASIVIHIVTKVLASYHCQGCIPNLAS